MSFPRTEVSLFDFKPLSYNRSCLGKPIGSKYTPPGAPETVEVDHHSTSSFAYRRCPIVHPSPEGLSSAAPECEKVPGEALEAVPDPITPVIEGKKTMSLNGRQHLDTTLSITS
jgi:hypothetical protein